MTDVVADVAIVGGGLTGLTLAAGLQAAGRDVQLFEARARFGGRAFSQVGPGGARYDLGPAWIWPHNHRARAAAERFGLEVFPQYATGALVFQDEAGATQRYDFAPMAGSLRIAGGVGALADALAGAIDATRRHVGARIETIAQDGAALRVAGDGVACVARQVVIAVPPRVAAGLRFDPDPPYAARSALTAPPTWMAAHAKLMAIYPTPFWRGAGLSGDANSRLGPLAEVHDASPADLSAGALFGFVGVPADARLGREDALKAAALEQLVALFGPGAAEPTALWLQDWAVEPETATPADANLLAAHPAYRPAPALAGLWDGRLHFCVSELAPEDGGFIEGAFAAAEAALKVL